MWQRYAVIASGYSTGIGGDKYYGYVDNLYDTVQANFAAMGVPVDDAKIRLVKGLFADTVPATLPKQIALAHIDCDWYEPVKFCLNAVWPKLATGGFVILDDYLDWLGCRKATDDFLAAEQSAVFIRTQPHAVLTKKPSPSLWRHFWLRLRRNPHGSSSAVRHNAARPSHRSDPAENLPILIPDLLTADGLPDLLHGDETHGL